MLGLPVEALEWPVALLSPLERLVTLPLPSERLASERSVMERSEFERSA